jgi:hypothetical protein
MPCLGVELRYKGIDLKKYFKANERTKKLNFALFPLKTTRNYIHCNGTHICTSTSRFDRVLHITFPE